MSVIQSVAAYQGAWTSQKAPAQNPFIGTGGFDALLASFTTDSTSGANNTSPSADNSDPLFGFAGSFIGNITASANSDISALLPLAAPSVGTFPFTSEFESTFGLSGPLPAFITAMTAKLGLNATQNQAFQHIAVENKDIVSTPDNIQKVAMELQQAGIGYPAQAA